jgi:hypothetical protein
MMLLAIVALIFALLPHDTAPTQVRPGTLAIVTVAATLVSLVSIAWSLHNSYAANGSSFNAIGLPILNFGLAGIDQMTHVIVDITSPWDPVTNWLAAPIIATLALIVAAQARRWGWLAVFIALSVLCVLGSAMIPELSLGQVIQLNSTTTVLFGVGFYQAIPMMALVIAALIFALWRPRAAHATSPAVAAQAS